MNTPDVASVRVRFAPSPTGHLHIGGLRAAIFNWLFARHHKGVFLLRIEDTDIARSRQEYTDSILDSLAWCNLPTDEPILIQTSRLQEHTKALHDLIASGKAYRCYCTQEELDARLSRTQGNDIAFAKYDGYCRTRIDVPTDRPFGIRFALPAGLKEITFHDLIRGDVTFSLDQFDDFIIARSDGVPLYNFVVVLDDAYMRITHIIRGEEHLSNTPKQILLYEAFGYSIPYFAHVPLILGPDGNKLSKRDAATSVLDYKKAGYLPNALVNYLVRLGWAHGDQEIFTRQELIDSFTLDHVGKKGAIFDKEKLDWVNSVYIRSSTPEDLLAYITQYLVPDIEQHYAPWNHQCIIACISLYQERVKTMQELIDAMRNLQTAPSTYSDTDVAQWLMPEALSHIRDLIQRLATVDDFTVDVISAEIKQFCKERSLKLVSVAQPIRLALVGVTASPGVFELLALLGKEESLHRLRSLVDYGEKR